MHGELEVGEIYKRKVALRPETAWLWALNGVPIITAGLVFTGLAATFDDAMAELEGKLVALAFISGTLAGRCLRIAG